jgi:dephospho-CoA kinase
LNKDWNLDREQNINSLNNIYWIGGSPCCGKSTISELLVKEFGFILYKCDDYLDRYIEEGAAAGIDIMKKFKSMNKDETWLHRDVEQQVHDEFEYYRHAVKIIKEELKRNYSQGNILVEGAAILPEFIKSEGIDYNKYVCIVPTKEFQLDKYSKREWVKGYLSDCSCPEKAFNNWMERDARFAQIVMKAANEYKMNVITVDGSRAIEDNYLKVKEMFRLV